MEGLYHSAGDVPASTPGANCARALPMRDGSVTLARVIDAYMAAYDGRDTTRPQRLGLWRARLGHVRLEELDDDVIHEAMESFAAQRGTYFAGKDAFGQPIMKAKRRPLAPATLNRIQAALSAVLTWAQRQRVTPKGWANPCRAIPMRRENNARVRYLADDERGRLLAACRASKWPMLFPFALLLLTSGCRRGEAEGLRWRDLDLDRGEATVARSKNGDAKVLVVVPAVVEALRLHQGHPDRLVFESKRRPTQVFNVVPVWQHALRAAGIRDFRLHDCRHDAASTLAKAGASLLEIGDVLGHRQAQVTKRYAHLCSDSKKRLVTRVMGGIGAS